jgi:hypothetical protein
MKADDWSATIREGFNPHPTAHGNRRLPARCHSLRYFHNFRHTR